MTTKPTEYECASVLQRVAAQCIDLFIVVSVTGLAISVAPFDGLLRGVLALALVAIAWGYRLLGDGLFQGAAIGKRLLRIRVVDVATRQPCSVGQSAIRIGVLFIPFVIFIELIVLVIERQQRWGDQLAKTYVLRRHPKSAPEVSRPLSPIDYETLRDVLDSKTSKQ